MLTVSYATVQPDAQQLALLFAHMGAVASVALVIEWAIGQDLNAGWLGGLDWSDKNLIFNYHPLLMVLGTVFAATEGILAYRTLGMSKAITKTVHLVWQSMALLLMGLGLAAAFENHHLTRKGDLWSLHSWLGMLLVLLFLINYLIGLLAFFLQLASEPLRARLLPKHIFLGTLTYLLAIFTAETGISEKVALMNVCTSRDPSTAGPDGFPRNGLTLPGCRTSNYLGLAILLTGIAAGFAVLPLAHKITAREVEDSSHLFSPPIVKFAYGSLSADAHDRQLSRVATV